ncbi:MAG: Gfo/Idh/MocA family protein [Halobacteriaceae archaeon]
MNFGVLGTANIARSVVIPAIRDAGHDVVAIASREEDRAEAVADSLDIPTAFGGYGTLLADADIDAVYNPLPNSLHATWTKRAADHGLDVLCEKPLTVDAAEARDVVDHCEAAGVTLMEAFMWRYHPRTRRVTELVADLGEIRNVRATFQFPLSDPDDIRLSPALGGGSLMDVGCYAMNAARLFLGDPERVYAHQADHRDTGVDTKLVAVLEYPDGATAEISGAFETDWCQQYRIEGTEGWIAVEDAFNPQTDPVDLTYEIDGRRGTESWTGVNQYAREIEAFAEATPDDPPETDGQEAIKNMELIDALYESARTGAPVSLPGKT